MKKIFIISILSLIAVLASCSSNTPRPDSNAFRMKLRNTAWADDAGRYNASFDHNGMPIAPYGYVSVISAESADSVSYVTSISHTWGDGYVDTLVMKSAFRMHDTDSLYAEFIFERPGKDTVSDSVVLKREKK